MTGAKTDTRTGWQIGSRIAPPRFLAFLALILVGTPIGVTLAGWRIGGMIAFDVAALAFLASCIPLLDDDTGKMRELTRRNDANRLGLLVITSIVSIAVLVAVAAELGAHGAEKPGNVVCVVATLAIAWVFSNAIYALHYAHLFYSESKAERGKDSGGVCFPDTEEPDYWDFVYFAFCLGMTFQTSDVEINTGRFRRVVTAHCVAAFVFNLGVVAFTINVLGGSS